MGVRERSPVAVGRRPHPLWRWSLALGALAIVGSSCASGGTASGNPTLPVAGPSGSPTPLEVTVPDVLYLDASVARVQLEAVGLRAKQRTAVTATWPPGTVIKQRPRGGRHASPGTVVTVTVAKAPKCDPAYPTICLAPFHPVKCRDIPYIRFPVLPPDPYRLDQNHDGVGCYREHA